VLASAGIGEEDAGVFEGGGGGGARDFGSWVGRGGGGEGVLGRKKCGRKGNIFRSLRCGEVLCGWTWRWGEATRYGKSGIC